LSPSVQNFDDGGDAPQRGGAGLERLSAAWRRRKWLGIIVCLLPLTATLTAIMALPDLYQSTALVLVERQQVPEAFVRPTVTSQLEIRLQTISQEILSRSRLESLITRFGLYPNLRPRTSSEAAVDQMRRDIQIDLRGNDPRKPGSTTAFALSYRGPDPRTVALVTNTLASFYIEENLRARERQATGTAEFLRVQLAAAQKRLDEQEAKASAFRQRNMGSLPQQMAANLSTLDSLNARLRSNVDNQIRLAERRDQLAAQFAQAKIDAGGPEPDEVRLARLRQTLVALRMKYTDLWPEIIQIKDEIARLEQQTADPKSKVKAPEMPMTPEVLRLQGMLKSVETELALAKTEEQRLRKAMDSYQARIDETPKNEQEFQELTRNYETTKELYQNLTKRFEEAQLAESMEQRQKGEQFKILDSAVPANSPTAPRRDRLLIVSIALSLALGAGAMILAEVLDTSFHSAADLRAHVGIPLLVSIPRILTDYDVRRQRWRFRFAATGVVLGVLLMAGTAYFFAHGNEQLAQLLSRGSAPRV
jgi:polysaccharide chain length determinant protein (PEP-CTERM system associated)